MPPLTKALRDDDSPQVPQILRIKALGAALDPAFLQLVQHEQSFTAVSLILPILGFPGLS